LSSIRSNNIIVWNAPDHRENRRTLVREPNMATDTERAVLHVALIGNPNTGKSTLFGALSGVRQRVGNYPGVTVEKKLGTFRHRGRHFQLIDLPGTYSLAPRSPDEMVTVDVLLGRQVDVTPPDVVLCIVDASNLQRNLYLVSQVLELGLRTILVLNMVDVAHDRGMEIDPARLQRQLGIPVVPMQAHRGIGVDELKAAMCSLSGACFESPPSPFPEPFRREVAQLAKLVKTGANGAPPAAIPRYLAERLLLDTSGYLERRFGASHDNAIGVHVRAARMRLAEAGCAVPAVEATARYAWVGRVLDGVVTRQPRHRATLTDRVDRVLTHRVWGTVVFAALMVAMFQSVFRGAIPLMDMIDGAIGLIAQRAEALVPTGALGSLLVDGLIAGVGGVLVFLPQIVILFFFIGVLEDCGYMARAAFLTDRLMVRAGLSGKSFIPLLSSFACAIPGIMATRVIENRRDRLTTILVAPLMSCSARLPVYTVLIAAFIPRRRYFGGLIDLQAVVLLSMYLLGMAAAVIVALVLKRTVLRGAPPPFVMELPTYKWPSPSVVLHRMLDRGWAFVRRAGTLIVCVSIVIWAMLYYPHDASRVEAPYQAQRAAIEEQLAAISESAPVRATLEQRRARIEDEIAGAYQRQSILGRMGRWVEPVVKPLGWDWRIGCAAIASFPAREVVVATLGVIYNLGSNLDVEAEGDTTRLALALRRATWEGTDRPVYNVPVALSIMVFFALCAQCAATLVVIQRETASWRWPLFTFAYMTTFAYLGALVTYQVGMLLI